MTDEEFFHRCRPLGARKSHSAPAIPLAFRQTLRVLAQGVYSADSLPELRRSTLAGGHLAVRLRLHVLRAFVARVPSLRFAAAHGALLSMWRDGEVTGAMILTKRCIELLNLLQAARWL